MNRVSVNVDWIKVQGIISKQKWNPGESHCECNKLDDFGSCKDDYMWNASICDCEYIKACQIDEYLDNKK